MLEPKAFLRSSARHILLHAAHQAVPKVMIPDALLDHDDDDDNDEHDDEQEVARTQPFQRQREKSGLAQGPEISYQEETTPLLRRRNVTDEELQRRLERLRRDSVTGLLDMTDVDPREKPLSAEEQQIEIQKVKDFIQKRYPQVDFSKLGPIRFSTKKLWILLLWVRRVVGPR